MKLAARVGRPVLLAVALLVALAPFYWMVLVSLSEGDAQIVRGNPWWLSRPPFFGNFEDLLHSPRFAHWMLNTALVTGVTLIVSLTASLAAGVALARMRRLGRGILIALLATYALPQTVLALPLVQMMSSLHLVDTPVALMIAYPGLVIPFGTWAIWSLLSADVARELLEQARVEGASGLRWLLDVLLPLARPSLAAVALFGIAIVFNDYLYLFTLITSDQATTVMGGVETTNVDVEDPGFDFGAMLLGAGPVALLCAWYAERYASRLAGTLVSA